MLKGHLQEIHADRDPAHERRIEHTDENDVSGHPSPPTRPRPELPPVALRCAQLRCAGCIANASSVRSAPRDLVSKRCPPRGSLPCADRSAAPDHTCSCPHTLRMTPCGRKSPEAPSKCSTAPWQRP